MSRTPSIVRARVALAVAIAGLTVVGQSLWFTVSPVRADDSVGTPDVTITLRGGLSDRDVSVPSGGIVRFVNRDDDRHRMRSRSGDGFDTGNLEPGESSQVRLSSAGTYAYIDEREDDDTRYHGRIRVAGAAGTNAGGGSTNAGAAGASASPDTARPDTIGGGTPAAAATVTIGDGFFRPAAATVAAGGTVTFENGDGDEHTATSVGAGGIDSGTLASGASYQKRFTEPGTYEFLCVFHPDMRGTVRVVSATGQAPSPAPPAAAAPSSAPTTVPAAPSADPGGGAPTAVTAEMADFEFRPRTIEVAAGGSITWTNAGVAPHTVSATDGTFDSGPLETGGAFEQTFSTPGSYAYLCQIHPDMTGTVEVLAAPAASPPPAPMALGGLGAAASETPDEPATTDSLRPASSIGPDVGPLAGIVAAVTLVSVAVALFARLLTGTVRRPDEG